MAWRILKQIVDRGSEICEDRAGGRGQFAWVLDGARSPGAPRFSAHGSDAAWLVDTTAEILRASAAPAEAGLDTVLDHLSQELSTAWGGPAADDPAGGPTCCLGLVHLTVSRGGRRRIEAAVVGDVVILVGDGEATHIWTDTRVEPFEARTIAALAGQSAASLPAKQRVAEEILRNRAFINHPEGFAVVSPVLPWRDRVLRFEADCGPGTRIAMMTDGFWRLVDPLDITSPDVLLDGLASGRASEFLRRLRAVEAEDRDTSRWPRVKVHDDASALVAIPVRD